VKEKLLSWLQLVTQQKRGLGIPEKTPGKELQKDGLLRT
jgi:hypothetical protein